MASSSVALSDSDTLMLAGFTDSSGATLQRALREALRAALDESPRQAAICATRVRAVTIR
jgi:hypothetical protein